ncbi:MAG: 2-oxoacid:acceptor oxidoreductase family protein [bacterium]|nr:2-oxoacid:acceptor oxidoreductase family protein [bacterium]
MIEIRFHGRGGQGAVKASDIFALAAFSEGKEVQSFPFFGVERRGAPVTAYTRISDGEIRIHCYIYDPDIVVVLDPSLIGAVDLTEGLKENGKILLNTQRDPKEFLDLAKGIKGAKIYTVDATSIAVKHGLGSAAAPIVNTAILGALAKISNMASIDNVMNSIKERIPVKQDKNAEAAKDAFNSVKE